MKRRSPLCIFLTFGLFVAFVASPTAASSEDQDPPTSPFLERFDANGDGKLSPEELPDPIRRLLIEYADANGDGELTVDELPDSLWQQLLARFDANGDGAVEDAELLGRRAQKPKSKGTPAWVGPVRVVSDVDYITGPEYGDDKGKLDIHLPEGGADLPVLFHIHGGGMSKGDKAGNAGVHRRFASQGFCVVTVNYRLSSPDPTAEGATYPDHIEDVAAAFRWTWDNIGRYGGDRERIFVWGGSAGGHLTASLVLDPSYLEEHELSPDVISGAIPISGLVDVRRAGAARINGIWYGDPEIVKKASPLSHVRKDAPPMLIMVADREDPDRIEQNKDLYDALVEVGHPDVEFLVLTDRTHTTIAPNVVNEDDETFEAMMAFLEEHGAGNVPLTPPG